MHGYKAHTATDQEAGLIGRVAVAAANVHDAGELEPLLPAYRVTFMAAAPSQAAGQKRPSVRTRWLAAGRAYRHLGRPAGIGPAAGAQCYGPSDSLPDRESLWHLQAVVWLAPDAVARPRQGRPAGQPDGHGLQPAPKLAFARSSTGVSDARSLPMAGIQEPKQARSEPLRHQVGPTTINRRLG
jgi:hypothetical protein